MELGLRASMNWLHTWFGVVIGGLLFAIFWMGTLSVFDREIDRWMIPATRLSLPEKSLALDSLRPFYEIAVSENASRWIAVFPTTREPVIRVFWSTNSNLASRLVDPSSGAILPNPETFAGTGFLYPFHYMLHIGIWRLGTWIVGLAGMVMLALCVSGSIVHRKIFSDFFTFRRERKSRRLILDLHNVTGVLALPFHIAITLSGLIVFYLIYFPSGLQAVYGNAPRAFLEEAYAIFDRPRINERADMTSMDVLVDEAKRLWDGDMPSAITIHHPGYAGAYVSIFRSSYGRISAEPDAVYFDAITGRLLHQRASVRPVMTAQHFIAGLHLIRFQHWTLRWFYFALGLLGCMVIMTGYLFWLESRRRKHAGVRIVEGLTVGSTTGIVVATLVFFVTNRLLPLGTMFLGYERAALETWAFYLVWLVTFGHAWLRPVRAWIEQCRVMTGLALAAVLLNWITTGDHLIRSLMHPHLWPIAGMDLMLLMAAVIAALTARKLQHRAAGASVRSVSPRTVKLHPVE